MKTIFALPIVAFILALFVKYPMKRQEGE
jgi:hypothetical protein